MNNLTGLCSQFFVFDLYTNIFICVQPLLKEYTATEQLVNKVMETGAIYDALLRGDRPESPNRRRSSVTPAKRTSISTPLKGSGKACSAPLNDSDKVCSTPLKANGTAGSALLWNCHVSRLLPTHGGHGMLVPSNCPTLQVTLREFTFDNFQKIVRFSMSIQNFNLCFTL